MGTRFGQIDPAQLNSQDFKAWEVLNQYKSLLLPVLTEKEQQLLNKIETTKDKYRQSNKILALIKNKDFPWDKFPGVGEVEFDEKSPGFKNNDHYTIYPNQKPFQGEIQFSIQEGKIKGKPFIQYWVIHMGISKKAYDNFQLYYGNDFDLQDIEQMPCPQKPLVFKMTQGDSWYKTDNPELLQEAKRFMEYLQLVVELKLEAQEVTSGADFPHERRQSPPSTQYEMKPIFIRPSEKKRWTGH